MNKLDRATLAYNCHVGTLQISQRFTDISLASNDLKLSEMCTLRMCHLSLTGE